MTDNELAEDKSYRVNGFCQIRPAFDAIKRGQRITDLRGIDFNPNFKIKPIVIKLNSQFLLYRK